jgi:hypothetical protein
MPLRLRVRLDLLSDRLRKRAVAGTDDPERQQARLLAFVVDFDARWQAQTRCSPLFTQLVERCPSG